MRIVDLTLPIIPHWRYGLEQRLAHTFAGGSRTQHTRFTLQSHWYTHIDAPRHFVDGGKTLEEYPLEMFVGMATVLDCSDAGENEAIDAPRLEKALDGRRLRDIVLVKTAWARKRDWTTTSFWDDAPFVRRDGAVWLREGGAKVVGFDFPQDHDIRLIRTRGEHGLDMPTHDELLMRGVIMIEYLTNMWSFDKNEVHFAGLPLNLQNADGAPIRAVVMLEE
jgi:kynurenine formamidase